MNLLACLASLLALQFTSAFANTEKIIFIAPPTTTFPDAAPGLHHLRLSSLSHNTPSFRTSLPVVFPNYRQPQGLDYWYLVERLSENQRYEIRVCWVATQPTLFTIDIFNVTHVFDTPELITALAAFSEGQTVLDPAGKETALQAKSQSIAFLRIRAAAEFYTTDECLMRSPPPIHVDIILDRYLGNILPQSLVPTVCYVFLLAITSWYVSSAVWKQLQVRSAHSSSKKHGD